MRALKLSMKPFSHGEPGAFLGCLGPNGVEPVANGFRNELRPTVRPDEGRHAAQDEQIGQDIDHIR